MKSGSRNNNFDDNLFHDDVKSLKGCKPKSKEQAELQMNVFQL